MPVFGLGTWRMGEYPEQFERDADVIRAALDLGVTLFDTAEMYGEGGAEEVLGQAILRPPRRTVPGEQVLPAQRQSQRGH